MHGDHVNSLFIFKMAALGKISFSAKIFRSLRASKKLVHWVDKNARQYAQISVRRNRLPLPFQRFNGTRLSVVYTIR